MPRCMMGVVSLPYIVASLFLLAATRVRQSYSRLRGWRRPSLELGCDLIYCNLRSLVRIVSSSGLARLALWVQHALARSPDVVESTRGWPGSGVEVPYRGRMTCLTDYCASVVDLVDDMIPKAADT